MDSNVQAMPQDLNGKSAFIVGASRGIGRAIVEEYADRGANVAIAARSVDDLETLAATVPTECVPIKCDICNEEAVERAVTTATDAFGAIDVVVNSAGAITRGCLQEASRKT